MLDPKRLGLSGGILGGLCIFLKTLFSIWFDYGTQFLQVMGSVYPGYTITYSGSFIGLAYGFFEGFIGFFLLAWFYNHLNNFLKIPEKRE